MPSRGQAARITIRQMPIWPMGARRRSSVSIWADRRSCPQHALNGERGVGMKRLLAAFITGSFMFGAAQAAEGPSVKIDRGVLSGASDGAIDIFNGIPYAAPPVGGLRWAPPAAPASWKGARDATKYGAICPQPPRPDRDRKSTRLNSSHSS